jgi:hypothetical protein
MAGPQNNRQLVVVLGMHRSGTSTVTRALEVLGFGFGANLLPAQDDNPKGFWEDADFVATNDRLMALAGERWDSLAPDLAAQVMAVVTDQDRASAIALLDEKSSANQRLALKDPRFCRLLPFWRPIIDGLCLDTRYVIVLRHPLSVAASLGRRNAMSVTQSLLLWLLHMLQAERTTRGEARVLIDFDRLLQEPSNQVTRMAGVLGLQHEADPAALDRFGNEYLSDELRHSRFAAPDLDTYAETLAPVVGLYRVLALVAADALSLDSAECVNALAKCEAEVRSLAPLLDLTAAFANRIRALEAQLAERDQRLYESGLASADLGEQVAKLQYDLGQARTKYDVARSDRDEAFVARDVARARLDALLESNSWRLTSPFRMTAQRIAALVARVRRQHFGPMP